MGTVCVAESRTVPVSQEAAYDGTLNVSVQHLFAHRHFAIMPITSVYGQDGSWGRSIGQSRVLRSDDGGALLETLTAIDRPHRYSYTLEDVRGRMRPFVKAVEGTWTFTPAGSGTEITWSWEITPRNRIARPVAVLVGRMFRGYARKTLASLHSILAG